MSTRAVLWMDDEVRFEGIGEITYRFDEMPTVCGLVQVYKLYLEPYDTTKEGRRKLYDAVIDYFRDCLYGDEYWINGNTNEYSGIVYIYAEGDSDAGSCMHQARRREFFRYTKWERTGKRMLNVNSNNVLQEYRLVRPDAYTSLNQRTHPHHNLIKEETLRG